MTGPSAPARRIAIIGGGLSGLATAWRLIELSQSTQAPVAVTVFEAAPRLGGIINTERIGDYLVDTGADSFLTNKPGALGLCKRLGLEQRLIATDPKYRGVHVLKNGRPAPVPAGFQLIAPSAIWPILTTPILSPWGKIRMLLEIAVPRGTGGEESLATFVRRRFGREVLERLVQPLVGGIYTSDPEKLSVAATLPRFVEWEQQFGSLILAARRQQRSSRHDADQDAKSSGARYGLFAGLVGGMEDLLAALRNAVAQTVDSRLQTRVSSVRRIPWAESNAAATDPANPRHVQFQVTLSDHSRQEFDALVVATTAHQAAQILPELDSVLASRLGEIEYASSAIVVTAHKLADVRHPLDSFGLVVPHRERRRILATSFSSRKFPDRAPRDCVLMRTFVGGAMQPELNDLEDDAMRRIVLEELESIFGVRGQPDFCRIIRYPRAMPQYHVGHLGRIQQIESLVTQHPGLALAGNYLHGVGIPDAITSGELAAESILGATSDVAGRTP